MTVHPPAPSYDEASVPPEHPGPRQRLGRVPRAAWLAAAALVVVAGVGIGGFFVGRATAPDERGRSPFENGQRPDFPGRGQPPGDPGRQGAPDGEDGSTDQGAEPGTDQSADGADATAWYVVPQAA